MLKGMSINMHAVVAKVVLGKAYTIWFLWPTGMLCGFLHVWFQCGTS